VLYVFRRHLGYDADEVIAMSWWKRRLYMEGLIREFEDEEETDGN
jgi:hypothetical protein